MKEHFHSSLINRIFLFSVFIFLVAGTQAFAKSKSPDKLIDEDLAQFEEILTQGYVAYDKAVKENGFDVKKTIKKIKSTYKKYYAYRKRQKKDYKIVNGIDVNALGFAMADVTRPALNIKDMHLAGSLDGAVQYMCRGQYPFYVNVWFEKADEVFVVVKSDIEEIKIGDIYTDEIENMRPWITGGKLLYRFGVISEYWGDAKISINGKEIIVKTNAYDFIPIEKKFFDCIETDETLYISLSTCHLDENNEAHHKELLEAFDLILEKAAQAKNKKNVIFDLRSNGGGFQSYPQKILSAIFSGKSKVADEYTEFDSVIRLSEFGTLSLYSPYIARNQLMDALANRSYDVNNIARLRTDYDDMMKNPSRFYGGYENPSLSYLPMMENPAFTGKLIILMDKGTASAAEKGITFSYLTKNQNIILVGENSWGCIDYGGVLYETLKNSGIQIQFPICDYTNHAALKQNPKWHGDSLGFMPDFWADKSNLMDTLIYLTGDKEIVKKLERK